MKLHIRYWPDWSKGIETTDSLMEKRIEAFFKKEGFSQYASGFYMTESRRDLCFETKLD